MIRGMTSTRPGTRSVTLAAGSCSIGLRLPHGTNGTSGSTGSPEMPSGPQVTQYAGSERSFLEEWNGCQVTVARCPEFII